MMRSNLVLLSGNNIQFLNQFKFNPMKRIILSWSLLLVLGAGAFAGTLNEVKPVHNKPNLSDKDKSGLFQKVENKNSNLAFLNQVFSFQENQKVDFMITSDARFTGVLTEIVNTEEGNEQFKFASVNEKGLTLSMTVLRDADPDKVTFLCKLSSPQHAYSLIMEKQPNVEVCCWKKDFTCSY
jgi:hypothetical protein